MKKYFTSLLSLLLILGASCAKHPPPAKFHTISITRVHKIVYIDDGFNETEKKDIFLGMKSWEYSTNKIVDFTFVNRKSDLPKNGHSIIVEPVPQENETVIEYDKRAKEKGKTLFTLGITLFGTDTEVSTIMIVISKIDNNLEELVQHETGHAIGLNHSDNKNSIMYFNLNDGAHNITDADIEAFCGLYLCDKHELIIHNLK